MKQPRAFDPDRVAYLEATGWRAYYDRDWLKLLRLVVVLCEDQFQIPSPVSLVAAYYVTRASLAWAPIDHNARVVQHYYERFYRVARRYSNFSFDPARVAELEFEYNDVHRQLVSEADKSAFIDTMVRLHSALFGLSPAEARESAEYHVRANRIVDSITGGRTTDVEGDWASLEDELCRCYRSIHRILQHRA
jgi:hypothetical protein